MLQAHFLAGETVAFRAPALADAEQAVRWLPGPFPWNAVQAERLLREQETVPWGNAPTIRLIAVARETGEILGGAEIERQEKRTAWITLTFGPDLAGAERERLHAEALRILVPWLLDELGLMTVTTALGDDEAALKAVAESLGMAEAVRLRAHLARPGGRADLLWFQALNPRRTPRVDGGDGDAHLAHHA
ncbi:MAG: GNAT family N-acetyltransferase [Chloroflexia bacterium]|nr:GNAT family N-acetyltransferase [Chloroflexia bacterium]